MSQQLREVSQGSTIVLTNHSDKSAFMVGDRDGGDCLLFRVSNGEPVIAPVQVQVDVIEEDRSASK